MGSVSSTSLQPPQHHEIFYSCRSPLSGCCLCYGKESWKRRKRWQGREGRKRRKGGREESLLDWGTTDEDLSDESWYIIGRKDHGCYRDLLFQCCGRNQSQEWKGKRQGQGKTK